MFSWKSHRGGRARRRPDIALVESLERRDLLAIGALGQALPDLTVDGFAPPVASWGYPMSVTVDVRNIGVNSSLDPLSLAPGSVGPADSPDTTVAIYASRSQHSTRGAVLVGTVDVPGQPGNSAQQVVGTITLPEKPARMPGDGGEVYLTFRVNPDGNVFESDLTNNWDRPGVPVKIQAPLPQLAVVGFAVPPRMQPGDTIQPDIRIGNLGPVDTAYQGDLTVLLVASTSPTFNSGSSVLATYHVQNVPGQALVPSVGAIYPDANVIPSENTVTISGEPVTLPTAPAEYYLGVVVDPYDTIHELSEVGTGRPAVRFALPQLVGPPIAGLPPAGVNVDGGTGNVTLFPIPNNLIPVGGSLDGTFPAPYPPTSPVTAVPLATPEVTATSFDDGVSATSLATNRRASAVARHRNLLAVRRAARPRVMPISRPILDRAPRREP